MAEMKKQSSQAKKQAAKKGTDKFKNQYFDYYDDIKSHTHKVTDW